MPDWLIPTFTLFPLAAWITLGVGLPWALALIPDHPAARDRGVIAGLALALGLLFTTAWMFALGTAGTLAPAGTLAGTAILAAAGAAMAWRRGADWRRERWRDLRARPARLSRGERLLLVALVLLLLANVLVSAYWPFLAYDSQWVYAYNARVFLLREHIPAGIGYYPQLLPLGYTLMQQAAGGGFDDHAARALLPWILVGSALAAYALGRMAWGTRRAGLIAAAGWMVYPHVAAWAAAGDLEIALALYVAGAAAWWVDAWRRAGSADGARSAAISGLMLAGALWTKPTGGALALGVMLVVAADFLRVRGRWGLRLWRWPRLRIALIAAAASVPLGGMWYVRNALLGHTPVTFPADYWHDLAQRSGQEWGWIIVLAGLIAGGLVVNCRSPRRAALPLLAILLLLAGTLPTALKWDALSGPEPLDSLWRWVRGDLGAAGRMGPRDWALAVAGIALLAWAGRSAWVRLAAERRETAWVIGGLTLPYAVVWFLDFSYHYRLSFAIVPLMIALAAALVEGWLWPWLASRRVRRTLGGLALAALTGIALAAALEFTVTAWRNGGLPDDRAKYDAGNPSLMRVVHMLERYADEHGAPVVAIPGEERLPFYFPDWEIRNSRAFAALPTRLEDLDGVDVYVQTSVGRMLTRYAGLVPNSLEAEAGAAMAYHTLDVRGWDGAPWPTVLEPIPLNPDGSLAADDGNFRYEAFTLNPAARTAPMRPNALREDAVIVGGFARFVGYDVVTLDWVRGERVVLSLYWQPTAEAPPAADYAVFVRLLSAADGSVIAEWSGAPMQGWYHTRFWRPGESILDAWMLRLPAEAAPGPARLQIGMIDPQTGAELPITVDGVPAASPVINTQITVQ